MKRYFNINYAKKNNIYIQSIFKKKYIITNLIWNY